MTKRLYVEKVELVDDPSRPDGRCHALVTYGIYTLDWTEKDNRKRVSGKTIDVTLNGMGINSARRKVDSHLKNAEGITPVYDEAVVILVERERDSTTDISGQFGR